MLPANAGMTNSQIPNSKILLEFGHWQLEFNFYMAFQAIATPICSQTNIKYREDILTPLTPLVNRYTLKLMPFLKVLGTEILDHSQKNL